MADSSSEGEAPERPDSPPPALGSPPAGAVGPAAETVVVVWPAAGGICRRLPAGRVVAAVVEVWGCAGPGCVWGSGS